MSEQKRLLKPCPFCGGKAYLETHHRAFINGNTTKVTYVRCLNCNARTERIPLEKYGKTSHSSAAEAEAINAWNRRTADRE
ncbi:MAG: Lar family restriction alleviation protein [Acutalibacteraceae bacterium]